jgi:hypothetical protein
VAASNNLSGTLELPNSRKTGGVHNPTTTVFIGESVVVRSLQQLFTRTKQAVYYVGNETIRSLIIIVSELKLNLKPLLDAKEPLVQLLLSHLQQGDLLVLQLVLLDSHSNAIRNGYGAWNFYVKYDAAGIGVIQLPVQAILADIRTNRLFLNHASNYKIYFWLRNGALRSEDIRAVGSVVTVCELPPHWPNGKGGVHMVGSFGWDPLRVSIGRE